LSANGVGCDNGGNVFLEMDSVFMLGGSI
jgi:hypothetical protein